MTRVFSHFLLTAAIIFGLAAPMQVAAHAIVVAASPAAKSEVPAGDIPVTFKFNSRIDRGRSRLALINARGETTTLRLEESAEDEMHALATAVTPGSYRLEWYVLSADGHITRGNVKFAVIGAGN